MLLRITLEYAQIIQVDRKEISQSLSIDLCICLSCTVSANCSLSLSHSLSLSLSPTLSLSLSLTLSSPKRISPASYGIRSDRPNGQGCQLCEKIYLLLRTSFHRGTHTSPLVPFTYLTPAESIAFLSTRIFYYLGLFLFLIP